MSYNIDSIETVYSKDFSPSEEFEKFRADFEGDIPEDSVLDDEWSMADSGFTWRGEWSGRTTELLAKVLALFDGEADLVLTWEGGDSHSGLRLHSHVVTEHEVVMTLGKQKS